MFHSPSSKRMLICHTKNSIITSKLWETGKISMFSLLWFDVVQIEQTTYFIWEDSLLSFGSTQNSRNWERSFLSSSETWSCCYARCYCSDGYASIHLIWTTTGIVYKSFQHENFLNLGCCSIYHPLWPFDWSPERRSCWSLTSQGTSFINFET